MTRGIDLERSRYRESPKLSVAFGLGQRCRIAPILQRGTDHVLNITTELFLETPESRDMTLFGVTEPFEFVELQDSIVIRRAMHEPHPHSLPTHHRSTPCDPGGRKHL